MSVTRAVTLIEDEPGRYVWHDTYEPDDDVLADLGDKARAAVLDLAKAGPENGQCTTCRGPVGYMLFGDADEYCRWVSVIVIERGFDVEALLCEACAGAWATEHGYTLPWEVA
jgi:hypothetical protein